MSEDFSYNPLDLLREQEVEPFYMPIYTNNIELGVGDGVQLLFKFHPLVSDAGKEAVVGNYMLSWETTARLYQSLHRLLTLEEGAAKDRDQPLT